MTVNKNKYILLKFCVTSVVMMGAFFIFTALLATPAKAITISQLNVEIVARPGETVEQLVQLYDESFNGSAVYPIVYNFTASPGEEGAALILTDPEDLSPDRTWVKWSPAQLSGEDAVTEEDVADDAGQVVPADLGQEDIPVVLPVEGTLKDFPYWIEIPNDAAPGTHLISLVFQLKPAEQIDDEGAAVYIGSNIAINIFLKVLGATIDDIEVDFRSGVYTNKDPNFTLAERKKSFQPKSFFLKPPVDFLVTVNNKGNTHQRPDGNIKIFNDLFGSQSDEISFNDTRKIVLPDTDRTYEVSSFGQGFMFGKYRAKLVLLYGDPLRPYEREISFWIVPLVEILIVLGIIILLIIIIIIFRNRMKKKSKSEEKERDAKMRKDIVAEIKGQKKSSSKGKTVSKKGQKEQKKGDINKKKKQ